MCYGILNPNHHSNSNIIDYRKMMKNYTAFRSVAKLVCIFLFMPLLLLATGDHTKLTLENLSGVENTPVDKPSSNESSETKANDEHGAHELRPLRGLTSLAPPCDIHVDAGMDQEICADEPVALSASVQNNNLCSSGCIYPVLRNVDKCNSPSDNGSETIFLFTSEESKFYASEESFETNDDNGTATYTATATNGDDIIEVNILYSGFTTTPPEGSPKGAARNSACNPYQDASTFVYYPVMSGTLISQQHGTFSLAERGESFQIGVGGDNTREGFGASGWFTMSGGDGFYERGDINLPLGNCQPKNDSDVAYRWSTNDGNIIGNRNRPDIQVDQPGTYTVRVTNCEDCVATDTVVITGFEVDAGDDVESCPDEDVVLTATTNSEPECTTCDDPNNFSGRHNAILYDLAGCTSRSRDGSANDYSEFVPREYTLDFASVHAGILHRQNGGHSCTTGPSGNPGMAACFGFRGSGNTFVDDAATAVRFEVQLDADKGAAANLDSFSFFEKAPEEYYQTSSTNNSVNRGVNNYPTRFGVRVLKNGQEIFKQVDFDTSREWTNRFIDFGNDAAFIVPEGGSATFTFELYAYRNNDSGGRASIWDLDSIDIKASTCEANNSSEILYLWSNGETTQSITVSPDETTTYSVTATSCSGCEVTDDVTVTIREGEANAGPDVDICEGQEAVLTASGGETYLWSTGETTAEITVTDAGEYTVEVTGDTGCTATDSVIVTVTDPRAGKISANPEEACLVSDTVTISGIPAGDARVPDGYTLAYVLTSGDDLVIQDLSSAPEFSVTEGGKYTIHPFVFPSDFDPSTVVEFGTTTGFDVNSLLVQGGGDLCASLDVIGAMVIVSDPEAGTVTPVAGTVCLEEGTVGISATPNGDVNIPDGYILAYVLTSGDDLVIQELATEPEFDVAADGKYTIHPFVYPSSFDPLSVVTPGVTTGGEVNALLVQGGGNLCASLDVAGAMVIVENQVSIGNYVWNDENQDGCQDGEMGINGITVTLFECADGTNPTGSPIASVQTADDSNGLPGFYNFEVCRNSGEYIVVFDIPTGFEATERNNCSDDTTDSDIGDNGNSGCFEILDDDNLTIDAGIFDPVNVGDTVFFDNDRDGVQDPDEDGVAGVTVQLKDTAGNVLAETVTDANGNYLFEAVAPGEYVIMFVPGTLPADYVFSPADQGGDDASDSDADDDGNTQPFTVTAGQDDDLSFDAGINLPTASLGDTVFLDENQNGIQDLGEEGVTGVTVNLFICGEDTPIATTTTDANGNYEFADLEPNTEYYVGIEVPADFVTSPPNQGGDDAADSDVNEDGISDCVELSPGENDPTIDAGIYNPVNVGDTVFFDNDRDGVQDPDEDGVVGVTVQLKDTAGNVLAETVTDANGNYLFEAVAPGEYVIMFVPGTLPADYVFSPADQGGDDASDSDADADGNTQPFTVTAGQDDDLSFDAGINLPTASLGDTVFLDINQDGIQDSGEEGVVGVTVNLYICGENTPIATTTTDANGNYEFADLEPNTEYFVEFIAPDGFVVSPQDQGGNDASDSDAGEDGRTDCVELGPGENNPTIDAGVYEPCPEDFANAGPDEAICNGDEVTLTASGGDSYLWSNGETTASITVSPTADTIYTVTVTTAVVCVDTDEVLVTVNDVTAIAGSDVSICLGEETTLTASGGATYLWSTGATTASIMVSPDIETTYTVEVTSAEGCTDTDEVVVSINPEVVADAGADEAICLGDSVTLTATGGVSYLWSNGATTASIEVTPTAETTYTVEVTSADGCTGTDEVVVSINPEVVADAGADTAICTGDSATLTASGGGTYLWSTGETTASISVSPTAETTYTVTVTSDEGCVASDEVIVSINPIVIAIAGDDVAICIGESATLTASGGERYLWSTGETSPSITVSPTTGTTYTVEVTSAEGCTDTDEVVVSINPEVVADAGADMAICSGDSATLTASGGGSYLWSTGETSPSITVSPTANTTYTVEVTSAEGCTDTDQVVVSINPEVVIDAGPDVAICIGDSTILTATASGEGAFLWSTGETTASITVSPTVETTYTASVTSEDGCVATDEVVVSINPEIVIDAGADVAICTGDSTTLTATASGEGAFLWSTGETTASITVSPTVETTYTASVTSEDGCVATDEVVVSINPEVVADAGADMAICSGDSATLTASGGGSYLWSTGETSPSITVSPTAGLHIPLKLPPLRDVPIPTRSSYRSTQRSLSMQGPMSLYVPGTVQHLPQLPQAREPSYGVQGRPLRR